jgi:hypothetical protein
VTGFFSKLFGGQKKPLLAPQGSNPQGPNPEDPQDADAKKKKGFFGKIAGIFKDDKSAAPESKPAGSGQPEPH